MFISTTTRLLLLGLRLLPRGLAQRKARALNLALLDRVRFNACQLFGHFVEGQCDVRSHASRYFEVHDLSRVSVGLRLLESHLSLLIQIGFVAH